MNESPKKGEPNYAYYGFLVSLVIAVWVLGGLLMVLARTGSCRYFVPLKNHPHVLVCKERP